MFYRSLCDNVPPLKLSLDQLVPLHKSYQNFSQHLCIIGSSFVYTLHQLFKNLVFVLIFLQKMQSFDKRNVPCFEFPRLDLVSDSFEMSKEADCSLFFECIFYIVKTWFHCEKLIAFLVINHF